MKPRAPIIPVMLLVLAVFTPLLPTHCAEAAEDQSAVIGITLVGFHKFDETDQVRAQSFGLIRDVAGVGHLFAEKWFGRLGFGYRYQQVSKGERTAVNGVTTKDVEIDITNHLVTAQFISWISDGAYTRLAFIMGGGPSTYVLNDKLASPQKYSTSGPITLYGLYLDWGGEGLGARLGWNHLGTDYKRMPYQGSKLWAEGSGGQSYLDLRWAF